MPRAGDAYLFGDLPRSHDPLSRINANPVDIDISIEDLLDMWRQWLEEIALPLISEVTGIDLTVLAPLLGGFTSVEAFIEMILNPETMLMIVNAVIDALGGLLGLDFGDAGGFLGSLVSGLSSFLGLDFGGLLDGNSPLDALNLFNLGNILGTIGIGNLSNEAVELLDNPGFRELISIQGGGIWTWDSTKGRSVPGSAKTTAGSVDRLLRSNLFKLAEGDKATPEIYTQWAGLTYTGTKPVRLELVEFNYNSVTDAYTVGDTVEVFAPASPGANQASWLRFYNENYVVPAGVTHGCLQCAVGSNASAGDVWFDDASVKKFGLLQMGWTAGLIENFLDIFGIFGNTTGGLPGLLTGLALMQNVIGNFLKILNIFDIGDVNGATPGFDPTTIIQDFISGRLNPSSLLQDSIIRSFLKGMIDQLASILRVIPFVGDDLSESLTEYADSAEAQNNVVVGTAAGLSQLAAAMGEGNPDADDFERTSLGPNWRVITSNGGSVTCNGHDLVMSHNADTDYIVLKTDKVAAGDYQSVEFTLGSAPDWGTVLVDTARAHNDGWGRCSNFTTWATRTGIRIRWTAQNQNVEITAWNNGSKVATIFDDGLQSASAGSRLKLEAGVLGVPRQYIIRIDGGIVQDVVESGTASQLGSGFRHRGLGGRTEKLGIDPFAISPDPGRLKVWTATG